MKQQILDKLGNNHTKPVELLAATGNEPYGLYTYRGDVYVLNAGQDSSFDDLTLNEKSKIVDQIISNNYKINLSLQ
jgi:hypothetical protein